MTGAHRLPAHWFCEVCNTRFVLQLEGTRLRCAIHSEDDHCHVGQLILDAEGRQIQYVTPPTCSAFATTDYD